MYATSFAGVVYKFNQADGKILSAVKSRATCAPLVVGKNIYHTRRTDDGKGDAKEAIASVDKIKIWWGLCDGRRRATMGGRSGLLTRVFRAVALKRLGNGTFAIWRTMFI